MLSNDTRGPRKRRPRIGRHDQRPTIERHIATLPADAPLRALISDPALDDRLKVYEDVDADARKVQTRFKRWARVALVLMTFATLVSSLMLFPIERLWSESLGWRGFVSGAQSAANAIALGVVWWLNRSEAVARWIDVRAEAERLRGDYFRAVLMASTPVGADPTRLLSEKLALIEAAHLDYQRGYLASAVRRHGAGSARRALPRSLAMISTVLSIVIGIVAVIAAGQSASWLVGIVEALLSDPIRWQLGLNTMASALLGFASARAMINQDDRNAALYRGTLAELDRLRTAERRSTAVASAAQGNDAAVLAYAAEAQAVLDADLRAWRLAREAVDPAAPPPPKWKVW